MAKRRPEMGTRRWRRLRRRILERDGYRCRACGRPGRLEVDHVVPVSRGGGDDPANLQALCRTCHIDKTAGENQSGGADPERAAWARVIRKRYGYDNLLA